MSTHERAPGSPAAVRRGKGGLSMVALHSADGATADVYLHGAHVTSWRPASHGEERLFLSARSAFGPAASIRGGIPVIFPQFAAEGPLPRHGFARTSPWALESVHQAEGGDAVASLTLAPSAATRAIWPAEFRAALDVRVGGDRLVVSLAVENAGPSPFSFTCALHTYLRVHEAAQAEVIGLQGIRYRESAAPKALHVDDAASVRALGELDRVYVHAPRALLLREPARTLGIELDGFPDVVLWNPGARRAAMLADMEPNGERAMLCVEAAAVQTPIALAPGARWEGTQAFDAA